MLQPAAALAAAAAGGRDLMTELSTPDARRKHVSSSIIQGLIQARRPAAPPWPRDRPSLPRVPNPNRSLSVGRGDVLRSMRTQGTGR